MLLISVNVPVEIIYRLGVIQKKQMFFQMKTQFAVYSPLHIFNWNAYHVTNL